MPMLWTRQKLLECFRTCERGECCMLQNMIKIGPEVEFESPRVRVRVLLFGPIRFISVSICEQQKPYLIDVAFLYVRHKHVGVLTRALSMRHSPNRAPRRRLPQKHYRSIHPQRLQAPGTHVDKGNEKKWGSRYMRPLCTY
jgi:hypothetical protein